VRAGLSREDARRQAALAFGGVEEHKEVMREGRGLAWLSGWSLDLKLGTRMLVKYPGLAIVGGIGMALATAIGAGGYAVFNTYFYPELPLHEGKRVVMVANWDPWLSNADSWRVQDVVTLRRELRTITDVGAFRTIRRNLIGASQQGEPIMIAEMTASGFLMARVPPLLGRPLESVAILGNAAGTTARALGVFYPAARVDGVELDPAVSDVGRRFFGMDDNPRLTVHDVDARPYLRHTDERYDLIVADAYHQPYVPFYLATREFFRLARARLEPGGILALNVASVPGDTSLLDGITGTLTHEFDQVAVWPALRFNKIVLAFDEPVPRDELTERLEAGPERLGPLRELLARQLVPVTEQAERPWTDDRAPVEWVTDRMIVEYAASGGELDEDFLPTRP